MVNVHEVRFEYERQKKVYVFGTLFYLSFSVCLKILLILEHGLCTN